MKNSLLILVSLLIISCTEENPTPVVPLSAPTKLTKVITYNSVDNETVTVDYEYTNNLLSKRIETLGSDQQISNYSYENGILKSISYSGDGSGDALETFYYNDALISTQTKVDNTFNYLLTYTYDTDGKKVHFTQTKDSDLDIDFDFEYDTDGNISKRISHPTVTNSANYTYTYTYDNKKNPYSLIYSNAVMKAYSINKNNIVSYGEIGEVPYQNSTFEYNAYGFPTKQTNILFGHTYIIQYFYN